MKPFEAYDVYFLTIDEGYRDTTGQALSWAFYELSQHPEVESKIVEEAQRVLGSDGVPNYENQKELKFATAVYDAAYEK